MEEELNEHDYDLEERFYSMLYHADQTQNNVTENSENALQILEHAPRSTVRRYWRTSIDSPKTKDLLVWNRNPAVIPKPKEENKTRPSPPPPVDLSIFQSCPKNVKSTIEIIEHENENQVILETSDEDEVIEVALPPKPTIMIESSDEDELQVVKLDPPSKVQSNTATGDRCISASPVPSVVSSISDEFIRGDCIALNISSRHPNNHSFDFSLHGPDLLDQSTPEKKKKKKKPKETITSTPVAISQNKSVTEEYFATPKSKARNRKKKSYTITDKTVPNADIYDSDSNQSIVDSNKNRDPYVVTEKSLPSADVYESDSSHSEKIKEHSKQTNNFDSSGSSVSLDKPHADNSVISKKSSKCNQMADATQSISIVDLTENDSFTALNDTSISENIVMGNVTGFTEIEDYGDENSPQNDISQYVSTKIPPILNEDLDFNNLNGNKTCKRRRYSLTTLRAEMDKFYNESWGGENFNHREIQKNMSRDKSLWAIDPKDRMPSLVRRKVTCNYCNRTGHRDDTCRLKPPICYMCGLAGHFEPRCPRKICVNCGEPNYMYSTMCRNCCKWESIKCGECGQNGHPTSHCPDTWRRYHNTIDENMPLAKNTQTKKHCQMYCSGCTRRGHLIHTCKSTIPFSGLPIDSPYVYFYRPIYYPSKQDSQNKLNSNNQNNKQSNNKNTSQDSIPVLTPLRPERNHKRKSKSPTAHESHVNKKRSLSNVEDADTSNNAKTLTTNVTPQRKLSQCTDDNNKSKKESNKNTPQAAPKIQPLISEKAPDFISITSTNYDKKGQIIQDNEVSDTNDVVSSARIYVTNDIIDKLKTVEGEEWLKGIMSKLKIIVQYTDINSFLSIKGKIADQEAFQTELRDWTKSKHNEEDVNPNSNTNVLKENNECNDLSLIPKNRNNLLRQLSKALNSLKEDIGDPKAMYKELTFFQNRHKQLLNQKTISPKQVSNNRKTINEMFKKLNMVLLGQAGLADGSEHLNELYSFQEKLMNSRQKNIPPEQRKEIGQHYYSIFAAIPRDDYLELLKKFYQTSMSFQKKNKKSPLTFNNKMTWSKKEKSIPWQQTYSHVQNDITGNENISNSNAMPIRQKLVFYHQRLLRARPTGSTLKKTRFELVRRLHSLIGSVLKNDRVSSKVVKKMKKAQEQAQLFLANV